MPKGEYGVNETEGKKIGLPFTLCCESLFFYFAYQSYALAREVYRNKERGLPPTWTKTTRAMKYKVYEPSTQRKQ